jgi:hypothetical protein
MAAMRSPGIQMKRQPRQLGKDQYVEGYLAGQVVAYCEQVKTGSRLAGQINCPSVYISKLIPLVAQEGCKSAIERLNSRRVSLWIYRDKLAKRLVDHLQSAPTSELGIWSMGKLFGYADREIVNFIERSK